MEIENTGKYIYRNIEGEGVLVPIKDNICNLENMLILNETSVLLWERIEKENTIEKEKLLEWLINEYEIEKEVAEKDLQEFIDDLSSSGCIEYKK